MRNVLTVPRSLLLWSTTIACYYWIANNNSVSSFVVVGPSSYPKTDIGRIDGSMNDHVVVLSPQSNTARNPFMILGMTKKTTPTDDNNDDDDKKEETKKKTTKAKEKVNPNEETENDKDVTSATTTTKKKTTPRKDKKKKQKTSNEEEEIEKREKVESVIDEEIVTTAEEVDNSKVKEVADDVDKTIAVVMQIKEKEKATEEKEEKQEESVEKKKKKVGRPKKKKKEKKKEEKEEQKEDKQDKIVGVETAVAKAKASKEEVDQFYNADVKTVDDAVTVEEKANKKEEVVGDKKEDDDDAKVDVEAAMQEMAELRKKRQQKEKKEKGGGELIPVKVSNQEIVEVSKKFFDAVGKIGGPALKAAITAIESDKARDIINVTVDVAGMIGSSTIKIVSEAIQSNTTKDILTGTGELAGKVVAVALDNNKTKAVLDDTKKGIDAAIQAASDAVDNKSDQAKGGIGAALQAASAAIGDTLGGFTKPKKPAFIDVTIPYDSAALLAYEEWLLIYKNDKEDDDEEDPVPLSSSSDEEEEDLLVVSPEKRYQNFQLNYQKATIANVVAKKKIRDKQTRKSLESKLLFDARDDLFEMDKLREEFSTPINLDIVPVLLDEYADLSPEEYAALMKSREPKSFFDLLGDLATYTGQAALNAVTTTSTSTSTDDSGSASSIVTKDNGSTYSSISGGTKFVKKKKPKKSTIAKKTAPKKEKPVVTKSPSKSLFSFGGGGGTQSVKKPPSSSNNPKQQQKNIARQQQKKVVTKKKKVTGVPELSKWKQNKDGSITGLISNSPSFTTGTRITTSPISKGAKAGSIVKTGSGSRYQLN